MKVAIVYNRDSQNVINLFGTPNREKIGLKLIRQIRDGLKKGGHQAIAIEADKDLIDQLEDFMPRVVKGERPGMVLNLSYGIQGQARYTHVPSILEMIGIPYVGSGPLAHSVALDKVITKMVLVQHGLPTPKFAVLESKDFEQPDVPYPCIVKPKHEAVSFGIRVCNNLDELREASGLIFEMFGQAVLVEQFIEGREVNVALLGNSPAEALPPVELAFDEGPTVYSYEDKTGKSGRTIKLICPAPLGDELTAKAQDLARRAFDAIGCFDCARVDMRMDENDNLLILEINSLPSLGPRGSYVRAAAEVGLDFDALANRFIEVASARYFGTPQPGVAGKTADPQAAISEYVTSRRDRIDKRLATWVGLSSRFNDPIGLQAANAELDKLFDELGMRSVPELSNSQSAQVWETGAGFTDGVLLVAHVDVPLNDSAPSQNFRRESEWLYGDGIATSRAPLVMMEYALRSLRNVRALRRRKLGVLVYQDEGRDARYSSDIIRAAMKKARKVLVLRPGGLPNHMVTHRRGQRRYRLLAEGEPLRPGRPTRKSEVLTWLARKLDEISEMSVSKNKISVSINGLRTEAFPMLLPHRVIADVLVTYVDPALADSVIETLRGILGKGGPRWRLEALVERPPLRQRTKGTVRDELEAAATQWEIPLKFEESVWPSVAGLAPESSDAICGMGPVGRDLYTPNEAVQRLSLIQRTLLLGEFLLQQKPDKK